MKLIAFIIIGLSLILGLIGAYTAYLPPLTLADERLVGLELNSDAGVDPEDPTGRTPLVERGTTVTPELLEALRGQDVARIHVKEFAPGRWTGWPLFLLGTIGMIGGASMIRAHNRAALAQAMPAAGIAAAGREASFDAIRQGVARLQRELPTLSEPDKLRAIIDILGEAQRTHVPAFVAARPQLAARLGLAGYAQLMDSFAAAERQINRAWSAAADGMLEEALERVENAAVLLEEAAAKLK